MESVTTEQNRLSEGMLRCRAKQKDIHGEQTVRTNPSGEDNATNAQTKSDPIGHSNPETHTNQPNNKPQGRKRSPPVSGQGSGLASETSEKPRAIHSGGGEKSEKSLKPSATPLRLRRLPASFWQEPNVPRDPSGKLTPTADGCFGSCGCQLHLPLFQNEASFGYGDYGLRSKYLDPVSPPGFSRPGHSFASISKFSGDPLELAYPDASASLWRQGAASFPSAPAVARSDMRPVFTDRPGSSARNAFSATAALYGHMMRRSLHGNYHHSNDVLADHLVSPIVTDDLWRFLPNRPLMNDFSKRFHPYL